MKIGGKKIESRPSSEIIVFSREDGNDLAFRASALLDRADFDRFCPAPKPGKMRIRGNPNLVENFDDPKYKQAVDNYNKMFMDYLFVSSLSAVNPIEGEPDLPIEWEKVKIQERHTWRFWDEELQGIGLGDLERKRLFNLVMSVNSLNEAKMDEARKSFLQRQREASDPSSSQMEEPTDMQYGDLANEPESDSQESQNAGMTSTNP
jgi:hypothetical protein